MNFEHNARTRGLITRLQEFMDAHVYPAEQTYQQQLDGSGAERWRIPSIVEDLKLRAKSQGLWNLFLPESPRGAGLKNLEYAPRAIGCYSVARRGRASHPSQTARAT